MIKIGILGIDGFMGRLILGLALKDPEIEVVSGYTIPESPNVGMDIGILAGSKPLNVKVQSITDIDKNMDTNKPDLFIDFTIATATEKNAPKIIEKGIPMVIGTTGLSKEFVNKLNELSIKMKIPLVVSTNMAIGVNVVFKIAAELARKLYGWEIEIIEAHHHRKLDSPSGTALTIAENITDAINVKLDEVAKYGRPKGPSPREWGKKEIGIHAIRAGDIVGDHTILYAGNGERIELKHQAHSRECFASGSIVAAKFLIKNLKTPKVYNMQEVLGLNQ